MTPLTTAVRAACDAVAKSPHSECGFPKCWCSLSDRVDILDYLLTTARAEATEAERERCARAAEELAADIVAAAIRAPATPPKDPTP